MKNSKNTPIILSSPEQSRRACRRIKYIVLCNILVFSLFQTVSGMFVASGSDDKTVRIWNIKKSICEKILRVQPEKIPGEVKAVAFNPDGKTVAAGSEYGVIRIWSITTKKHRVLEGVSQYPVNSLSFNPNGNNLVAAYGDGKIAIWDLVTNPSLCPFVKLRAQGKLSSGCKVLEGHTRSVTSVSFGPDGKIASGSIDGTVRIWDVETSQCLKVLRGHDGWVNSVSFSRDGKKVASAGNDGTVRIWDVTTGESQKVLSGVRGTISSVSFSPDGTKIVAGSFNGIIRIWNLENEKRKTLLGHANKVTSISFSPDGKRFASGSADKTVKIWNVEEKRCEQTLEGHEGAVTSVSCGPVIKKDPKEERLEYLRAGYGEELLKGIGLQEKK